MYNNISLCPDGCIGCRTMILHKSYIEYQENLYRIEFYNRLIQWHNLQTHKLHRENGPARISSNNSIAFYIQGRKIL